MFDAIRRKQALASLLRQKGFELSEAGQIEAAIEAHTQARAINEELGDIGAAAGDVTNTAIIYERLEQYDKAEELHLEAARMDEGISYNQGLRIDYNNLARFYAERGSYDEALKWHRKLIEVNLALGDISGSARNYRNHGFMLVQLGRHEEAIECHKEAEKLNEITGDIASQAEDIANVANIYEKTGDKTKSLELFLKATSLNEKVTNIDGLRENYRSLARLYAEQGDLVEARKYQQNLSLLISRTVDFPELNAFLIDASGMKSAISIVKREADTYDVGYDVPLPVRNKSRQHPVIISDSRLNDINERIEKITARINQAKQIRGQLEAENKHSFTRNGEATPEKEFLEQIEQQQSSEYINSSNENNQKPAKTEEELRALKREIFTELTSLGKALYAVTLPGQVKKVYRQLQETDAIEIGISEKILEFPWELMHDGKDFICLSNSIGRYVVIDDDSNEIPNVRRSAREKLKVLIIGDPCGIDQHYREPFEHLAPLPGARREAQQLAEFLSQIEGVEVNLFIGEEINTFSLLSELTSDYDLIHYTGHAIFADADPMESGLVLHDGVIRAYEIASAITSQRQPPVLAFINACESSREIDWNNEVRYENQVFGLASAFLKGGVNYIGTMWPLHDDPAIEIALGFYSAVFDGNTFGEALRVSRKKSYDKYGDDEIAWASYVLYGDPTGLIRKTQHNTALLNDFVKQILASRLFGLER